MVRIHLKKLNNMEGKENCKVKSSNSSAALENLQVNVDINTFRPNGVYILHGLSSHQSGAL
jgi:protein involved in polysaccharide export with SLBB domain